MPLRPDDPNDGTALVNQILARLRALERAQASLRLPDSADPLQTFENGSPLGDTRFMNFGPGVIATLVGPDYVDVTASAGSRWGTVVVAASDTHQAGKDSADFTCTGSADQTTLDLALDAAPSGGEIVLLEGTYNTTAVWTIDTAGIHVRGMGMKTIISRTGASGTDAINITNNDVRLSELYVKKTSGSADMGIRVVTPGWSDIQIRWVFVEGFDIGIQTAGTRWRVENCRLLNNASYGIHSNFGLTTRSVIQGNIIVGGVNGVHITGGGTHVAIIGNYISDQTGVGGSAISADAAWMTVVGNVIQDGGTSPLEGSGADSVWASNIVRGGGAAAGINCNGARINIVGNRVEGVTGVGITASDGSTCVGNIIRSAGTNGIQLTGVISRVTVSSNTISLCGQHGIALGTTLANGVFDSTIQGNTIFQCSQTTDNTYDGIFLIGSDRNDIQGNTIRQGPGANDHRYGINISEAQCDDNLVCNNDLFDSAQTAAFNDAGTNTRSCTSGGPPGGGSAVAPANADYLVGTANGTLTAEIVVGTTPGGELGNTWASPTVDSTHSGSAHTDFIAKAFFAAKGDLIGASANDTPIILTVGTDNFVLVADSTTASGLAWKNVTTLLGATSGWGSITNVTPDKVYDADATTLDEIADVLGTLVANLVSQGILSA